MNALKIGDTIESAVWITGDEASDVRQRFERDVGAAIDKMCTDQRMIHGPVTWLEKHPMEDRVPAAPDHVQGSCVRLLVGAAQVVAQMPDETPASFVANLEIKDLLRLRQITRRVHARRYPGGALSDESCDAAIEELGPEAALDTLRTVVDGGHVH